MGAQRSMPVQLGGTVLFLDGTIDSKDYGAKDVYIKAECTARLCKVKQDAIEMKH